MGKKGDKLTSDSDISANLLVTKLESIGGVTSKKMFGGHGIFHENKMFGIVDSKGVCFLKTDETTLPDFEAANSDKHSRMPYYSIPLVVLKDQKKLMAWAKDSIRISK